MASKKKAARKGARKKAAKKADAPKGNGTHRSSVRARYGGFQSAVARG